MTSSRWTFLSVTLVLLAAGAPVDAAGPHRLGDLHSGPGATASSYPGGWIDAGDHTFFLATHTGIGRELYVTDGTPGGTRLLADSQPGASSADLVPFGVTAERLFWWAPDPFVQLAGFGSWGTLWTSDGTPEGTEAVLPAGRWVPDPEFTPHGSTFAGGHLYFAACEPDDCALWRSDGTPQGTSPIHPLSRPVSGVRPADEIAAVGERLFYVADGELWTLEPGGGATLLLSSPDPFDGPRGLEAAGGRLLFQAWDDAEGFELWSTDGTPQGTQPLSSFVESRPFGAFRRVSGSRLYFLVDEGGNEGYEIWTSDGTPAGTGPVTRFEHHSALDISLPDHHVAIVGDRVFVVANPGEGGAGGQVWVSDGTPETTRSVLGCGVDCPRIASGLAAAGGRVLFVLEDQNRLELWSSDGTVAGTGEIATLCIGSCSNDSRFSLVGGEVALVAGGRVWVSGGTAGGTRPISPSGGTAQLGYDGGPGVGRAGACWLFAGSDHRGVEPWCTEGTPESARLLRDIDRSAPSSEPRELLAVGGRAVFSARDEEGVRQVWSSDGGPGSARALTASPFDFGAPDRRMIGASDFALFFEPSGNDHLWRTDGTLDGTFPVGFVFRQADVAYRGSIYSFGHVGDQAGIWEIDGTPGAPRLAVPLPGLIGIAPNPVVVGDLIFFVGMEDQELWRSDGTPAGTFKVSALPSEGHLTQPPAIARLGGKVYFVVDFLGFGQLDEIWSTDGTPGSARRVAVIPSFEGDFSAAGGGLHAYRGALYFGATTFDSATGHSGGTVFRFTEAEGLTPLASSGSRLAARGFAGVGDRLYFGFDDGVHGAELWRTDGTPGGTRMVADLHSGGSSSPFFLTPAGDRLYFSAGSDRHGRELWVVEPDGEVRLVSDLFPGAFSSDPWDLTVAGNTLFFSADDGETGREPWALPLGDIGPPPPPPGPFLTSPAVPGFRFKVRITGQAGASLAGRQEPGCIPETLCVSGAVPGRSEVFLRVVGPKPNGLLWPTLVKFSTSRVEVWVEQIGSGETRYYDLAGAAPGIDVLPGLFDRQGFAPGSAAGTAAPSTAVRGALAPAAAATGERLASPALPGFTFRVEITDPQGQTREARVEGDCIEETVCLSGAVPGRSELFLRVVGPKPNGRLWPTLVRFSTSTIDVWLTQTSTGQEHHYRLEGASPGSTDLSGLFDRDGFLP